MDYQAVMEKAARGAIDVVRNVKQDQLELPTPCHEWTVRTLANHLMFWTGYRSDEAARKETGGSHDESRADLVTGDWAGTYERQLNKAVAAWAQPGAWEGTVGETPAPMYGQMMIGELVLHGWDLARATGQELVVEPDVAEAVREGVLMFAEQGREYKIYAEPVPVPESAPDLDRALGLSGRDPNWAP